MAVEVWPAQTGKVAGGIGAVVAQEKDGISHNIFICVFYANVGIGCAKVAFRVVFKSLLGVIGEYDKGGRRLNTGGLVDDIRS